MRIPRRADDPVGTALLVSWVTVVWSTTTGMAASVVGMLTGSLSLAGLGVTVLIDVASSVVLIWRFNHERGGGQSVERAERVAHRVASGALVGFSLVLAVQASRSLAGHARPEVSIPGVVLAGGGMVILPVLARWKYRAADAAPSRALRADAHITSVAAAIAGVTLAGLVVVRVWGWWWADAAAALVLATIAARQGVEGIWSSRPLL
jgi:divalent metal cation (Fe/Co/Zn/Cd) transporter